MNGYDDRYGAGRVLRAELFVASSPSERLSLYLDKEQAYYPRRYNEIIDDYIYSSFEIKDYVSLSSPSVLIPSRYKASFYFYEARNHHLITTDIYEYDVELRRHDASPEIREAIEHIEVPTGFLQYNEGARQFSLIGSTPEGAYSSWVQGASPSEQNWFWETCTESLTSSGRQTDARQYFDLPTMSCGPLALAGLLHALGGINWSFNSVARACGGGTSGMTLEEMLRASRIAGQDMIAVETTGSMADVPLVAYIAVLKRTSETYHYVDVVPIESKERMWEIRDFPYHLHRTDHPEETHGWTGLCLMPDVPPVRAWVEENSNRFENWEVAGLALTAIVLVFLWTRNNRSYTAHASRKAGLKTNEKAHLVILMHVYHNLLLPRQR